MTEAEIQAALQAGGYPSDALSTEPPVFIYPIGVAVVLFSTYLSYRIATSG